MWRLVAAIALCFLCGNVVFGEEFTGTLTKVDDSRVTFIRWGTKARKAVPMQLPYLSTVKVVVGSYNKEARNIDAGDAIPGGFGNEIFRNLDGREIAGRIITNTEGTQIVEVRVFQVADKKKKKASPRE